MMQVLFFLKKSRIQVVMTAIKGIVEDTFSRTPQMIEVKHM